uniref:Uncharacterized protein n=1 Tax=Arundo donax TaxID=35708 RepID=A0A0A9BT55_ARUDO
MPVHRQSKRNATTKVHTDTRNTIRHETVSGMYVQLQRQAVTCSGVVCRRVIWC